jgi:hypothetical protein
VDPRAGLDDMEKLKFLTLLGLKLRSLSHPACSQLLLAYTTVVHIHRILRVNCQCGENLLKRAANENVLGFLSSHNKCGLLTASYYAVVKKITFVIWWFKNQIYTYTAGCTT